VKNIGKPCAGKSHARFDEGGLVQASLLLYHYLFSNLGWDDFMHTSIDIDDQLLLYAKHQAVQQGCTIKKILEDALRDFFRIKH